MNIETNLLFLEMPIAVNFDTHYRLPNRWIYKERKNVKIQESDWFSEL